MNFKVYALKLEKDEAWKELIFLIKGLKLVNHYESRK